MDKQISKFCERLTKLPRSYHSQPYPADVRAAAVVLWANLRAEGRSANWIGEALGIRPETLMKSASSSTPQMAPVIVEYEEATTTSGIRLTSPDGWMVEGIDTSAVIALLRALQ